MRGETIYSKAADVIRERGHNRGWYEGPDGVCVHGAVHVARGHTAARCAGNCPADAIYERVNREGYGVASWNDDPRTSIEDVLLLLKELHVEAGGS